MTIDGFIDKYSGCPLRPLPDKKPHAEEFLEVFINAGYNVCIAEILGDKE